MSEFLTTVADAMTPSRVHVSPGASVAVASDLLVRHHLSGLPVVDQDRVVGLVTIGQLLLQPPYRTIAEVMLPLAMPATPDLSLVQARALATQVGVEVLPVVEADRLVGQVSLLAILQAMGHQTDPLTDLPWASVLRVWAEAELSRGREVVVMFVDLDNFGAVNKQLGHVAGDEVLRSVASLLSTWIDVTTDMLCRYGGDEFAIATIRSADEAQALAARLQEQTVVPAGTGDARGRVTASVGCAGGRRIQRRVPTHTAANVDDLISLASRASTAAKESTAGAARRAAWAGGNRGRDGTGRSPACANPRVSEVIVSKGPDRVVASVRLRLGQREGSGTASGSGPNARASLLVAKAAVAALPHVTGDTPVLSVGELSEVRGPATSLVVVVLTDVADPLRRWVGTARAPDGAEAAADAVLDAVDHGPSTPPAEIPERTTRS